jgi:hypothetical protein
MVGIAATRMPGNYNSLAVHRARQMGASAVVPDKKIAAFQHGTHLTKRRATNDDGFAAQKLVKPASFFPLAV